MYVLSGYDCALSGAVACPSRYAPGRVLALGSDLFWLTGIAISQQGEPERGSNRVGHDHQRQRDPPDQPQPPPDATLHVWQWMRDVVLTVVEELHRIHRVIVPLCGEVQMRTGGPACRAFEPDHIPDAYHLVHPHEQLLHVAVRGRKMVAVIDLHGPAATAGIPGREDHLARLRGVDGRALRVGQVYAQVIPGESADPVGAPIRRLQVKGIGIVVGQIIPAAAWRGTTQGPIRRRPRHRRPNLIGVDRLIPVAAGARVGAAVAGAIVGWPVIDAVVGVGGNLVGFTDLQLFAGDTCALNLVATESSVSPLFTVYQVKPGLACQITAFAIAWKAVVLCAALAPSPLSGTTANSPAMIMHTVSASTAIRITSGRWRRGT